MGIETLASARERSLGMFTSGSARQWPVTRGSLTRVTQAGRAQSRSLFRISPRATRFASDLGCNQVDKTETLQAVVIGGSISGMLAARTLSRFAEVVIIEKDDVHDTGVRQESFKETASRRPGVPQTIQPHQLIAGAVEAIETLLPGFRMEVIKDGAIDLDLGLDVHYYDYGGIFPKFSSDMKGIGITRRYLEECIRKRVIDDCGSKIQMHTRQRVTNLRWVGDTIAGVILDDGTELIADLVIDAAGRRSQTGKWLAEHGMQEPRTLSVHPHVVSASRMVKIPTTWQKDWKLLVCKTQPHGTRGGTLLPTEDGMWQVTLAEVNGKETIKTEEDFLSFAKSLPDPTIYEALVQSTALTDVTSYNAMKNERVCYHEIDIPPGLLIVGDAVQRHNAIYGQGIAASSQGIVLLDKRFSRMTELSLHDQKMFVATMGNSFQRELQEHLEPVWKLATKSDLKYEGTSHDPTIKRPTKLELYFTRLLLQAAQSNKSLYLDLLSVAHLIAPDSKIFTNTAVVPGLLRGIVNDFFSWCRKKLSKVLAWFGASSN